MMISCDEAKKMILDLFEEEALVIGGLVAVHDVEDDLIWRLVRSLDAVRVKALGRIEDAVSLSNGESLDATENAQPHPAIEEFLLKLRRT